LGNEIGLHPPAKNTPDMYSCSRYILGLRMWQIMVPKPGVISIPSFYILVREYGQSSKRKIIPNMTHHRQNLIHRTVILFYDLIHRYIVPALDATGDGGLIDVSNDISLTTIGE